MTTKVHVHLDLRQSDVLDVLAKFSMKYEKQTGRLRINLSEEKKNEIGE